MIYQSQIFIFFVMETVFHTNSYSYFCKLWLSTISERWHDFRIIRFMPVPHTENVLREQSAKLLLFFPKW